MTNQGITATPLQSVIAGTTAGGLEALVTYPTEYVKTRKQLLNSQAQSQSPFRILVTSVRSHGPGVLYTGAGPFCTALAATSGIRFLTFDTVKSFLPSDPATGKSSTLMNMLAGVTAGVVEALTIVTPGENLKTRVVDDRAGSRQYRSATHALRSIIASEGVSGLFRGALPVTLKQGSNALVRFTTYNAILDKIQPWMARNNWSSSAPALAGASAGVVIVYATMPFDVIKTKVQSITGQALYRSTWHCFTTTLAHSGVRSFWEGTAPRLVRMSVAGALSFSIYAHVVQLLQQAGISTPTVAMM